MTHDRNAGTKRARCPEDVLGWIPWYADGGLTERERGTVEAHAAECAECRAELDIIAGAPWSTEGLELPDADRLFDEITARIESEARGESATVIPISRGRALSGDDMARLERWVLDPASERVAETGNGSDARSGAALDPDSEAGATSGPESGDATRGSVEARRAPARRTLPLRSEHSSLWAAAAALVLLALGGLAGGGFERWREGREATGSDYQLASVPPPAGIVATTPMLDVVFDDAVTARAIWSTLRELGVEVVAGPSNLGVYRLRLTSAAAEGRDPTSTDAAAIAAHLVAPGQAIAIFAEPVP